MDVHFMPTIGPHRFEAIKAICGDGMPMTFRDWRRTQDAVRRVHIARGDVVIAVGIDDVDFRRFCKRMNCKPEEGLLAKLAVHLAGERKITYPYTPTGNGQSVSER